MTKEAFSHIAPTLPTNPGIYKYFNKASSLIYVGKAKNLRKRISSYFTKSLQSYKTIELVNQIDHIEFTIVDSEQDAFLLENSLIKEFQPYFNISLKDDKTYPYIVIKNEPFPRVFFTRQKINDGSTYFGPYTSVGRVRELLNFIKQNIPLRTCKLNLTKKNIEQKKFKVCLEFHLGNCLGPCEGYQTEEEYMQGIERVKDLLKGNLSPVIQYFKGEMKRNAEKLAFEKADAYRAKIDYLREYKSKSVVVGAKTGTVDVFSILEEGDTAYVNYLGVNNGTIVQTQTVVLKKKLEETAEDVLGIAITRLRERFGSEAKVVLVPFPVNYPIEGVQLLVPKGGDRKKLIDLSLKNVNYFISALREKKILRLEEKSNVEKQTVLKQLQKDLHLPALPNHIECFDNSNFHGSFPVAAMVCFKNGAPDKKNYRRFNIKTVIGSNDFASMQEIVLRRYKRLKEEGGSFPQLVIIDGGKGQLNAALESINELGLRGKMSVVGLAEKREEVFFPGDSKSLELPWNSESLKLIRHIRDEVHRFGITFHRQKRSKGTFVSDLEQVSGIGKTTAATLLKKFRSVKNIRLQSEESLAEVIGKSKAGILWHSLHAIKAAEEKHH